jgi:hypothetical protein
MLLKVMEINMWEKERWSYILDLSKQDASSINYLMIFIRVANIQFEKDKENARNKGHADCFASSKYSFEFFDSFEYSKGNSLVLVNKNCRLHTGGGGGYKSGGLMLDKIISNAKMKSAMITMRDKKENKLYKSFEDIFLKGFVKTRQKLETSKSIA